MLKRYNIKRSHDRLSSEYSQKERVMATREHRLLHLGNGQLETIIPFFLRRPPKVRYIRERITTPDTDFLDLDWSRVGSESLVVLAHGLESNTQVHYMKGMVSLFNKNDFDCLAMNYRGCSGEINRTNRFYHSGATDDLETTLRYALTKKPYKAVYLIGFSLGGNLILKFLGDKSAMKFKQIKGACTFSVPCCLKSSSQNLAQGFNKIYAEFFLQTMRRKILAKKTQLVASGFQVPPLGRIKTLEEFDKHFTGPLHGMRDANEYYQRNSAKFYLKNIKVPTLIVNSKNDPFLTPECSPVEEHKKHAYLSIELTHRGGHVGFLTRGPSNFLWSELRALDFIKGIST